VAQGVGPEFKQEEKEEEEEEEEEKEEEEEEEEEEKKGQEKSSKNVPDLCTSRRFFFVGSREQSPEGYIQVTPF
jgi:hypothetical protein